MSGSGTDGRDVVDEVSGISALSTDVAELCGNTEEQSVLLGKGLILKGSLGATGCGLSSHISVGNLRNGSKEEDDSEDEDEDSCSLLAVLRRCTKKEVIRSESGFALERCGLIHNDILRS